ncbi:hypothetical protein V1511DRAFT_324322 [Dipodascopsis uninucleata]
MVFTLRWGLIGAGAITENFVKDILSDPVERHVFDVAHKVHAVSSRSKEKAQAFIDKSTGDAGKSIIAYGSYDELFADPDVDCVYIGIPHSLHYQVSLLALQAGKNVLCEKPFTINANQAKHLVRVAREKKVFFMEAMWTKFFPLTIALEKMIFEERILGPLRRVSSDLSYNFPRDARSRLYDPNLGGGSLLDLGIYTVTWAQIVCYNHPDNHRSKPSDLRSLILKSPLTGVDDMAVIVATWEKPHLMSVATCAMTVKGSPDCQVRIEGEDGYIILPVNSSHPEEIRVYMHGKEPVVYKFPIPGCGLFWEADSVARDIRDGKLEDDRHPLEQSIAVMEILDTVRAQNGLIYPQEIESTEE